MKVKHFSAERLADSATILLASASKPKKSAAPPSKTPVNVVRAQMAPKKSKTDV